MPPDSRTSGGSARQARSSRAIAGHDLGRFLQQPVEFGGEPLCATCTRSDAGFWTSCPACGETLDALPGGKPVEHLRSVLVAIGTLPRRDEQMARLEHWITAVIAGRGDQHMLHHYAVWHLMRRLRHRTGSADTTHNQLAGVRQHVKAANRVPGLPRHPVGRPGPRHRHRGPLGTGPPAAP